MKLTPVNEYAWTDDYSFMRTMTCVNHPTARYSTKNPWTRSIHLMRVPDGFTTECPCSFKELVVIENDEDGKTTYVSSWKTHCR